MPFQQPVQPLELGSHSRVRPVGPCRGQSLLRHIPRHTYPHSRSARGHSRKVMLREPYMHLTPATAVLSPLAGRSRGRRGHTTG